MELLKIICGLVERKLCYIYFVLGWWLIVFVLIYIYVYWFNIYDSLVWVNDMINFLFYRVVFYVEFIVLVGVLDIFLYYFCYCYIGIYWKYVVFYCDEMEVVMIVFL